MESVARIVVCLFLVVVAFFFVAAIFRPEFAIVSVLGAIIVRIVFAAMAAVCFATSFILAFWMESPRTS